MFSSKYDTSAMRIHMEFTRKAVKRLARVNQRKGEKLLPDQIIREMAEYIEHRMEDGDPMIAEFTVRFDDDLFLTVRLSQGCYYILDVDAVNGFAAVYPVYVWERVKVGFRSLLARALVGWSNVYDPKPLVCVKCY